jgi:hypothetical protein
MVVRTAWFRCQYCNASSEENNTTFHTRCPSRESQESLSAVDISCAVTYRARVTLCRAASLPLQRCVSSGVHCSWLSTSYWLRRNEKVSDTTAPRPRRCALMRESGLPPPLQLTETNLLSSSCLPLSDGAGVNISYDTCCAVLDPVCCTTTNMKSEVRRWRCRCSSSGW